jgi:hypothetical protein
MSDTMKIFGHVVVGGREHQLADGTLYPVSPSLIITVQSYGVSDPISISPPLATETEIESYIAKLSKNLEAVARLAKVQLRLAR